MNCRSSAAACLVPTFQPPDRLGLEIVSLEACPVRRWTRLYGFATEPTRGMTPDDIAAHLGFIERLVVLDACRREEIDAGTLRVFAKATGIQATVDGARSKREKSLTGESS